MPLCRIFSFFCPAQRLTNGSLVFSSESIILVAAAKRGHVAAGYDAAEQSRSIAVKGRSRSGRTD
jgi:hypothetical protein